MNERNVQSLDAARREAAAAVRERDELATQIEALRVYLAKPLPTIAGVRALLAAPAPDGGTQEG